MNKLDSLAWIFRLISIHSIQQLLLVCGTDRRKEKSGSISNTRIEKELCGQNEWRKKMLSFLSK